MRALIVPWAAAKFPSHGTNLIRSASAAAASAATATDAAASAYYTVYYTGNTSAPADAAASAFGFAATATSTATAANAATLALTADADEIDEGLTPAMLAGRPLWLRGAPNWVTTGWANLKRNLLATNEDWDVWTDWYEARLAGKRPWRQSLEIARATLPDDLWKQGPKEVNAEIKRLIAAEKAKSRRKPEEPNALEMAVDVPPIRPAAIEPTVRDGRIVLPSTPAMSATAPEVLGDALGVLREEMLELADLLGEVPNIDQRPARLLRQIAETIPADAPPQAVLFRIGHRYEVLAALSGTVDQEWEATLTARFGALIRHYERVVRQFPRWREFVRTADSDDLTIADLDRAPPSVAAESLAAQLDAAELLSDAGAGVVAPEVAKSLDDLAAMAGPELPPEETVTHSASVLARSRLLAADTLESIGNILKWMAEPMLRWLGSAKAEAAGVSDPIRAAIAKRADRFVQRAGKSVDKELDRIADNFGPGLWKWFKRLAGAGLAWGIGLPLLSGLATAYPAIFSWLDPLLKILGL